MADAPGNLLILGAGFSWNAGLPLASGFTRGLLDLENLKSDGPSVRQVRHIQKFVDDVFGDGSPRDPSEWPELEDIFTLIDLSANTGHHLGVRYSAADLRVIRRSILVRMIRMLSQTYKRRQSAPDTLWRMLEKFFDRFDASGTAVLSMNWDTVFEQGIARTQDIRNYDYGCDASPCAFEDGELVPRDPSPKSARILKPHGSVNWLYCDACREMFWVLPHEYEKVAQTLFRSQDWRTVIGRDKLKKPLVLTPKCPHCRGKSLGSGPIDLRG